MNLLPSHPTPHIAYGYKLQQTLNNEVESSIYGQLLVIITGDPIYVHL